jgi:hypothetical protein
MPPSVKDLIHRAVLAERKHGPAGVSFAPIYSFTHAVAQMARGQERQDIIDALPKDPNAGKSAEWTDGYNAAMTAVIRVIASRSMCV